MTDQDRAAVGVAQDKTNADKEDLAVKFMIDRHLKPKKALKMAGLDYQVGGKDYNRVVGKRRRGGSQKKRRRLQHQVM